MWRQWLLLVSCLFCIHSAQAAPPVPPPLIAVIIDDIGDNLSQGLRAVRLPAPVATAFLPHTFYARRLAQIAHKHDKEVMLHLPMEASDGAAAGPGAVTLAMDEQEFLRTLESDLASLPHVVGINNHMGSLLTSDTDHMRWLMQAMRRRGDLFFVDSRTTVATVAQRVAEEQGVPTLRRHVFLDNDATPAAIAEQFARLLDLARRQGSAIAIGHPHAATLDFLERRLPQLAAEGIQVVPVQTLLQRQAAPTSPRLAAAGFDNTPTIP